MFWLLYAHIQNKKRGIEEIIHTDINGKKEATLTLLWVVKLDRDEATRGKNPPPLGFQPEN
jgi:hypothetical protein